MYLKYIMYSVLAVLGTITLFMLLRVIEGVLMVIILPLALLSLAFFVKMQMIRNNPKGYDGTASAKFQELLAEKLIFKKEERKDD